MEATSYYFDHCSIHLENIIATGTVSQLTLMNFYYTDGLDFTPDAVSGNITITEVIDKSIKGTFDLVLESNYMRLGSKRLTGTFGLIN